MKILLIIGILIFITTTYPKWSYKVWHDRCEENSKHSDFVPFSGKKYIKIDKLFINKVNKCLTR